MARAPTTIRSSCRPTSKHSWGKVVVAGARRRRHRRPCRRFPTQCPQERHRAAPPAGVRLSPSGWIEGNVRNARSPQTFVDRMVPQDADLL
jgi:hypothetical protein